MSRRVIPDVWMINNNFLPGKRLWRFQYCKIANNCEPKPPQQCIRTAGIRDDITGIVYWRYGQET